MYRQALVALDGCRSKVACTGGIAVYSRGGTEPLDLLKQADKAMYHVKGRSRNAYCFASKDQVNI